MSMANANKSRRGDIVYEKDTKKDIGKASTSATSDVTFSHDLQMILNEQNQTQVDEINVTNYDDIDMDKKEKHQSYFAYTPVQIEH